MLGEVHAQEVVPGRVRGYPDRLSLVQQGMVYGARQPTIRSSDCTSITSGSPYHAPQRSAVRRDPFHVSSHLSTIFRRSHDPGFQSGFHAESLPGQLSSSAPNIYKSESLAGARVSATTFRAMKQYGRGIPNLVESEVKWACRTHV